MDMCLSLIVSSPSFFFFFFAVVFFHTKMKSSSSLVPLSLLLLAAPGLAGPSRRGPGPGADTLWDVVDIFTKPSPSSLLGRGWDLTWLETFSGTAGSSPSSDNWLFSQGTSYPGGAARWGNNEFQFYTASPDNAALTGDGTLQIIPRHAAPALRNSTVLFTSARLETRRTDFVARPGGQLYIEGRIRIHGVSPALMQGHWAAFWALGASFRGNYTNWPFASEWDFIEVLNGQDTVYSTIHCGYAPNGPCNEYNGIGNGGVPWRFNTWNRIGFLVDRAVDQKGHKAARRSYPDYDHDHDHDDNNGDDGDDEHETWKDEKLLWFLNGELVHNVTGAQINNLTTWQKLAHEGHFLLLNVAMGGNWPGPPNNQTVAGEQVAMEVDYVGVWNS